MTWTVGLRRSTGEPVVACFLASHHVLSCPGKIWCLTAWTRADLGWVVVIDCRLCGRRCCGQLALEGLALLSLSSLLSWSGVWLEGGRLIVSYSWSSL